MPDLALAPPFSAVEPVTEILHGVSVTDPYRWLEDQDSSRTRRWIRKQRRYARAYLDAIPGRDQIRARIREFLAIETYDSIQRVGGRYFFRKRLPDQEQPCIYMHEGADGEDQLLVDPSTLGQGIHTAVKPLSVSRDGRLLLYEIKEGGERTGTFALVDTESGKTLPDILPRGYLRGFAFAPDGKSFVYVHEAVDSRRPFYRAAYRHFLGTDLVEDREVFSAGEHSHLRLGLVAGERRLGFLVCRFGEKTQTDFYLSHIDEKRPAACVLSGATYGFVPQLVNDRVFAITDREAPNFRIIELRLRPGIEPQWVEVVPERAARIQQWLIAGDHILVSYIHDTQTQILRFDLQGAPAGEIAASDHETIRLLGASPEGDEVFLETESFAEPIAIERYYPATGQQALWARRSIPFDPSDLAASRVCYRSKDGRSIPMFLVGRRSVVAEGCHPTIMTSYGGYGVSMTPQFSVFVAFLVERGCLFVLPNIRGGSEFGAEWYNAARRHKRQTAFDDFLSAAEWLIKTGRTTPDKLAIFGGSNSGLLVGAAMTQRPDLFRAVVCMVPMLDMLRYHLFDSAHVWREEFGTADDPADFESLSKYSPYHQVQNGVEYPATMIVSGEKDSNCNPLHARKMTARLQAATASSRPILLDYSDFRGHSPVLPLSERIEALTDRMAFLCDQLQLAV